MPTAAVKARRAANPLGVKRGSRITSRRTGLTAEVVGFAGTGPERKAKLRQAGIWSNKLYGPVRLHKVAGLQKNYVLAD